MDRYRISDFKKILFFNGNGNYCDNAKKTILTIEKARKQEENMRYLHFSFNSLNGFFLVFRTAGYKTACSILHRIGYTGLSLISGIRLDIPFSIRISGALDIYPVRHLVYEQGRISVLFDIWFIHIIFYISC